ncbi:hypothetical protein D3C77_247400 [compost metagenome]
MFPQGSLAYQVDGTAWVAGAGVQAVDTAQKLDAFVLGHIQLAQRTVTGDRGRQWRAAIDGGVGDGETAREKVALVTHGRLGNPAFLQRDAGHLAHDVGQAVEVLVLDLLAGHDRDRMRDLTQRRRHLAANGCGAGAIAVGVRLQAAAFDGRRAQFHGAVAQGAGAEQVDTIFLACGVQSTAGQQYSEALLDGVAALQAG